MDFRKLERNMLIVFVLTFIGLAIFKFCQQPQTIGEALAEIRYSDVRR